MAGSPRHRRPLRERARDFVRYLPVKVGYERGPRWMSELRKRWVLLRHPHATVKFGDGVFVGPGFKLHMPGHGTFEVGDRVEFRRGFHAEISGNGRITIGDDSRFTYYVLMQCSTSIDIGRECMFGQSTIVLDGQHRFRDLSRPMLEQGYDFNPLTIHDGATVTTKCTVMADIGSRAFVGANAVVSRPVPAYTVAVGAPARPVDYFGPPGQQPAELSDAATT